VQKIRPSEYFARGKLVLISCIKCGFGEEGIKENIKLAV
jgi:hypothetical protein